MNDLSNIILRSMEGGRAYLTLILVCFIVICGGFIFLFWRFHQRMASHGVPLKFGSIVGRLISVFDSFSDGAAWYLKNLLYVVAFVALAIACWGFAFSIVSGDSTDFGRSGALITLLAFVIAFLSSSYAERVYEAIAHIGGTKAESNRAAIIARAESLSRKWSVLIVIPGTLIWGYGDLMFDGLSAQLCHQRGRLIRFECVRPVLEVGSLPEIAPLPISLPIVVPLAPQRFRIFFDWNDSSIGPSANRIVWRVAEYAKNDPKAIIQVFAYADASGSKEFNAEISARRAKSVKDELVKLGVNEMAIATFPRGATDLVVATRPGVRELQNRRVEIWIGE